MPCNHVVVVRRNTDVLKKITFLCTYKLSKFDFQKNTRGWEMLKKNPTVDYWGFGWWEHNKFQKNHDATHGFLFLTKYEKKERGKYCILFLKHFQRVKFHHLYHFKLWRWWQGRCRRLLLLRRRWRHQLNNDNNVFLRMFLWNMCPLIWIARHGIICR